MGQKRVEGLPSEEFALKQVQPENHAGFLFVNLDPAATLLPMQAGGLADDNKGYRAKVPALQFAHRLTYEIKANRKNIIDTFWACSHGSVAHPAFVDLVDIKNDHTKTYDAYSSHMSPPGRSDHAAYAIPDGPAGNFATWWLWPNVTFNVYPGSAIITVFHIQPTGPETTLEHFDFFFADETPSESKRQAIDYVDKVLQPEDIALVESVQRGLQSRGYNQGRLMVDKERS